LAALLPSGVKVMLLGFSIGGIIATEFTRRHPEQVLRLLLVAPGGLLVKAETPCRCCLFNCLRGPCGGCLTCLATCLVKTFSCFCRRRVLRSSRSLDALMPDVAEPAKFQDVSRVNVERLAWNMSRAVNSYLRVLRRMPLWEDYFRAAYEEVASGPVPVLFLWGDSDGTIPWFEVGPEVTRIFGPRGASCIMIPGGGHAMMLEFPEQIAQFAAAWFWDSPEQDWKQCLKSFRLDRGQHAVDPFMLTQPPTAKLDAGSRSPMTGQPGEGDDIERGSNKLRL